MEGKADRSPSVFICEGSWQSLLAGVELLELLHELPLEAA